MRLKTLALILSCAGFISIAQGVTFNTTFTNSAGETWTADRMGVINTALAEWESLITNDETIDVEFDFTNAGTTNAYLGQWSGGYSAPVGTDIRPWYSGVTHTIHFNADLFSGTNYLWWDPTPSTSDDQPFEAWDALSVARHELGHLMGFTTLYVDNFSQAGQIDLWEDLIVADVFDPAGLNVAMNSGDPAHVDQSLNDLMSPAISNSIRRDISSTDLAMLSTAYYDYVVIPEPATLTLLLGCGVVAIAKRKRK